MVHTQLLHGADAPQRVVGASAHTQCGAAARVLGLVVVDECHRGTRIGQGHGRSPRGECNAAFLLSASTVCNASRGTPEFPQTAGGYDTQTLHAHAGVWEEDHYGGDPETIATTVSP